MVDPLIVHLPDLEMVEGIAVVPASLEKLAAAFWPGPLTVILEKKPVVPDLVTAGKSTVAIRIPAHPVAQSLLARLKKPLAAPSANPFGYVSPTRAEHVADSFRGKVPYIIDGGSCEVGLESTILDLTASPNPCILRPGAISADSISEVLGIPVVVKRTSLQAGESASAPGTFIKHYSPGTTLFLFESGSDPAATPFDAVLYLKRRFHDTCENVFWLTEDGSMQSAAKSLYSLLRQIDVLGFPRIYCELPGEAEDGFTVAVRDRLTRAAAK